MADFNYNMGYSYNSNSIFTASRDREGNIYQESTSQGRNRIGYDIKYVEELQEQFDKYYQIIMETRQYLIDKYNDQELVNGKLLPFAKQKTPEEMMQEQNQQQAQINKQLLDTIASLKDEILNIKNSEKELKDNGNNRSSNIEVCSPDRSTTTGNGISDKQSEANDSGNRKQPTGNKK